MGCCSYSKSLPRNDFSEGIVSLHTKHRKFMQVKKGYAIFLDHRQSLDHVIVIRDGENEDISFELTIKGSKSSGQEEAVVKVTVYDETNRSHLQQKATVVCSLYELAAKAAEILESNPHHELLTNNCQEFCNKFIEVYTSNLCRDT